MIPLTPSQRRNYARWATALESGKYTQTNSVLKRKTTSGRRQSYCCMGVWCELKRVPNRITELVGAGDDPTMFEFFFFNGHEGEDGLPNRVWWVEQFGAEVHYTEWAELNDDEGMTFKEIAGVIRMYLQIDLLDRKDAQKNPQPVAFAGEAWIEEDGFGL
jgi:hypothetical protein